MDGDNPFQAAQTVDPEVRGYVYSLVNALGGTGTDEEGQYVLGDDALACMRDLKRWLKLYDEKTNRLDVARCLAEANLVNKDLLSILASWPEDATTDRTKSRIALACLELLVPLTWPLETGAAMTVNHHRHTPYLQQAQVVYKAGILGHDTASFLRTIVRVGLPSIAVPRSDRTSRDEGIIKLILYCLRNVAVISPIPYLPSQGLENEVSRSATIEGFRFQDVFALLLTICSNMGEDFDQQDVIVLEILFHLTKGIEVEKLFMSEEQQKTRRIDELKDVLSKESGMKRDYAKTAPTRHGRFGTMIWVKRDDDKLSAVSGQDNLRDGHNTLLKMDKSKKFNKPQQKKKDTEHTIFDFDKSVRLTPEAGEDLRVFAEEFLDSGFNPLFMHLRKAVEREADRIQEVNVRQYFYVVAWFLRAERARRECQKAVHKKDRMRVDFEVDSYGLVAAVLNQETFILLNRMMQKNFDNKEWQDLNATMRFFTQVLLTVQEMAQSPLEDDQEIAENIQNRIFYEETTHDRIVSILKAHKDQGFGYLDASTELAHVFLRMLERYSKDNVDLQIRSKRKARRKKKEQAKVAGEDHDSEGDDERSENEDAVDAAQVTRERKFDFGRFSAKFSSQKSVDAFVTLTSYYRDLSLDQLKRAHRFFHRVAFKQNLAVLLYRMDVISLFHRIVKGPDGLDISHKMYKEWEELVRQLLKRMFKKIAERPELVTELLFSKINATLYYLEYGHEKQTSRSSRTTTELEVKGAGRTLEDQIKVVVAVLAADEKIHFVKWAQVSLQLACSERKSWEAASSAERGLDASVDPSRPSDEAITDPPIIRVRPRHNADTKEMNRNARLRLLMTLVGMERIDSDDGSGMSWRFPSTLSSQQLADTLSILEKHMQNPPTDIDGIEPAELLRRTTAREDVDTNDNSMSMPGFLDDSEGSDIDEALLFPDNIRWENPKGSAQPKKRRLTRKRRAGSVDDSLTDERRKAREEAALARRQAIKSNVYIHESDEESDEERDKVFYAAEERRRDQHATNVLKALATGQKNTEPKKRRSTGDSTTTRKKRRKTTSEDENKSDSESDATSDSNRSLSDDGNVTKETPISSQVHESDDDDELFIGTKSAPTTNAVEQQEVMVSKSNVVADGDSDEDDDGLVQVPRRRVRAGFVVESDDDDE